MTRYKATNTGNKPFSAEEEAQADIDQAEFFEDKKRDEIKIFNEGINSEVDRIYLDAVPTLIDYIISIAEAPQSIKDIKAAIDIKKGQLKP